jgi:hypothetical protein
MTHFVPERDIRGNPVARCSCDDCGAEKVVRCNQLETSRGRGEITINEGQALAKLTADGWTYIKKVVRCPKCEAIRKEKNMSKEPTVVNITPPAVSPIRQPTRDQKRLIVAALEDSYDTKNQRYKGLETDKGIAEMLGDGTMPGWVSAVREDMFGPDGNEEMGDLAEEIKAWMKKVDDQMLAVAVAMSDLEGHRSEVKKYQDRLNKIIAAIGPKAEKVA